MPCSEERDETSKLDHSLASRLLKARTILISGPVDEELTEKVVSQALVLDAESQEPIRVIITTPGGMVDFGFAIHDILRYVQSEIIAIGAGFVASMGVPILLSAKKENRLALPNTRFMMHQPSGGGGGQAKDVRITAQEIIKTRERLNMLIALETGQPIEKVATDSDRDFWMSSEQALAYGLITRIITSAREVRPQAS